MCERITAALERREYGQNLPHRDSPVKHVEPLPTGKTSRGNAVGRGADDGTMFTPANVGGIGGERATSAAPQLCCPSLPRPRHSVPSDNASLPSLPSRFEIGRHVWRHQRWRGTTSDLAAAIGCRSIPEMVKVAGDAAGEKNGVIEACEGASCDRNGSELDSMGAQFRKGLGMGRARFRMKV